MYTMNNHTTRDGVQQLTCCIKVF